VQPTYLILVIALLGLTGLAQGFRPAIKTLSEPSAIVIPANYQGAANSQEELSHISEQWAKFWSEKQLDQVIELYASDAIFLTATGDRTTGKAAIRELFKVALETNTSKLAVRSITTEVSGNLAYDSGDYRETIAPQSQGAKREGQGNYLVVFRKEKDGRWLIVQHMWTDKRVD
jgi:uncharacterized protein (TIGR02246 family)